MGKEDKNLENLENPFGGFNMLKGEFTNTEPNIDDDIKTGTEDIIEEPDGLEDNKLDEESVKKANEALEKIAKKQEKAIKKKTSDVEDDIDSEEDIDDTIDDDDESKKKSNTDEVDETGYKGFVKTLYEKGTIDFDDTDEDFEPSEEGLEKIINKTVQNRIDKWAQSLPEDYARFLEFVQSGGNPKEFLDVYYGDHSWETFDLESENNQKMAIRESLKLSGESEEDINDMIDEWEVNGTLEKRAKSAITKLQKHEKAQKEELVKIQKIQEEKRKAEQLEYWNNFKKQLYEKDQIAGFKVTPKLKDKLWDFMTTPDKEGKTKYQRAVEQNADSSYLFAYLAMNNFDSSKLEKQVETKVSHNMSKMLKNYANSTKNRISSGGTDDNYDTNPFSAFKQIK